MTVDQEYLRTSLRASLLATLAANLRHEDGGIRLFEMARIYIPRPADLPDERETLCGVLCGARTEGLWKGEAEAVGFFDAKGVVEALLSPLAVEVVFEDSADKGLRVNHQAAVVIEGNRVGVVGELHSEVARAFEIARPVYLFEIDLTALEPFTAGYRLFQPIPRFPVVVRDMALVVDADVTHRQIRDIVQGFSLVSRVAVFDIYSGDQVPLGKKSMAYRITFQSSEHTLTDDEVDKVQQKILSRLAKDLGAVLRG
jgi:phenylalanyl-tRNA synthetase beta chain